MNQEKSTTFPSDLGAEQEPPPSKEVLDSIARQQEAERRMLKEREKIKADLLERIGRRAGEWLDRVLPKRPQLENGEYAKLSFQLNFSDYGPPPDEEELYELFVKEIYEEGGV